MLYLIIAIIIILILLIFVIICNKNNRYLSINNFTEKIYHDIGVNHWSSNNLPPNIKIEFLKINNTIRRYLKINFNRIDIFDNNVLLCFPGGGESMFSFLNYTNFDKIDSRVIIFEGQKSGNKYTFQNAFPWVFSNFIQNDIYFVDSVIKDLLKYKLFPPKLFLTGKSDGAGFAVLYANISFYKKHIKAIGLCSAAHFGTKSINNIGYYGHINKTSNGVIIPYNIILPPNISIFIMHGTNDQVMPYNGQHYKNKHAYRLGIENMTIWPKIDPNMDNTYTPNIYNYVNLIIDSMTNSMTDDIKYSKKNYSCQIISKNKLHLNFITINGQNHCWSGHTNSGPESNDAPNMNLDATYLLSLFFRLKLGKYIPTINFIPHGLKAYDGHHLY